jgi:dTDP-4-amino-4,6-dideoxygalactose transaminase
MGSEFKGRKCGTIGDMGTFSFFPSHTITTGEGGMITTNNDEYAALARRLRNHGKMSAKDFHFDVIGFNGKMTSIQAAIGLGMLKSIDRIIEKRRENYLALRGREHFFERVSPHAVPVICESEEARDSMLEELREKGIECRNLFSSIPTQEKAYAHLGYKLGDFPVAEDIGRRGLYVPVHHGLTAQEIERIKGVILETQSGRA